jgi:hypothetical protein
VADRGQQRSFRPRHAAFANSYFGGKEKGATRGRALFAVSFNLQIHYIISQRVNGTFLKLYLRRVLLWLALIGWSLGIDKIFPQLMVGHFSGNVVSLRFQAQADDGALLFPEWAAPESEPACGGIAVNGFLVTLSAVA